jgi:CheY-like chemotaxis protein
MNAIPPQVRKTTFLVLEDNAFQRALITETLRAIGAGRIEVADSFQLALEMTKHFVPGVVLCNWSDDFDGIGFTKTLRRGETIMRKQTGIILGNGQGHDRQCRNGPEVRGR